MNRLRLLAALGLFCLTGLRAATLPACSDILSSGNNGTTAANTLAALLGAGSCYSQDKIFSNFVYSGAGAAANAANTIAASLTFQVLSGEDIHGFSISANGGWTASFAFGYTITVCSAINGNAAECALPANDVTDITFVTNQLNAGPTPNGSAFANDLTYTGSTSGGLTLNTSGASGAAYFAQSPIPGAMSVHSIGTFNGVGNLISFEQDFTETLVPTTGVPEPAALALAGAGLAGLAMLGRRSRRRRH